MIAATITVKSSVHVMADRSLMAQRAAMREAMPRGLAELAQTDGIRYAG
jgi:hypothetical protein